MKLQISLVLDKEVPPKEKTKAHCGPSIEERVKDAVTLVESGHESREEWEFLRRVNNALMKIKKLNDRQNNLLKMISPVLRKHSSSSGGDIEMDSEKLQEANALFT